jgi:hypothetical protein
MRSINKNSITTEVQYAFGLNNKPKTAGVSRSKNLRFFADAGAREVINLGDLGVINNVNLVLHQSFTTYNKDGNATVNANGNYVDDIWGNACSGCKGMYVCFELPCFSMPCIDLCPVECPEDCDIDECTPCDRLIGLAGAQVKVGQVYQDEIGSHKTLTTDLLNIDGRRKYDGAQVRVNQGNFGFSAGYGRLDNNQGVNHLSKSEKNVLDLELRANFGKLGRFTIGHLNHDIAAAADDKSLTHFKYDLCFNQFNLRTAFVNPEKTGKKQNFSVSVDTEMNGTTAEFTYLDHANNLGTATNEKSKYGVTFSKNLDNDTIGFVHYDSDKKEIDVGVKGGFLLSLEGGEGCEPCLE